jgi:hypothetical protein
MLKVATRLGRWPVALTLAAVAACSDEPAGPPLSAPTRPSLAAGDVYTVTNTNDSGIGSLRWSLGFTTGGEVIRFDPSLAGKTIALDSTLSIRKSVTIEGPAGAGITIDGAGKSRVLQVPPYVADVKLTLRNLSITGGNVDADGAAIWGMDGMTLVLENTTVYGNKGHGYAAIVADTATFINTTISGNTTYSPQFDFTIVWSYYVTLINTTVAYNAGGVGAVSGNGGTRILTLRNSVISNNDRRNCPDKVDTFVRQGANISDDDTCGGPSEITIADPKLAPLADNGGPAKTHALPVGSPAINTGSSCSVQTDERYVPRDTQCDLGAYEFTDPTKVTLTVDGSSGINQNNKWATVTGTITCTRTETFNLAVELRQTQKVGKDAVEVDAAATIPVYCTTGVRPWSASLYLTSGEFQVGTAQASVFTLDTPKWVTPASATKSVKLFNLRK